MEEKEKYRNDQIEIQELNRRNAEKELIKEENYKNVTGFISLVLQTVRAKLSLKAENAHR